MLKTPFPIHLRALTSLLLAAAMFLASPAQADPPGRIGRVAWISGDVRLSSASTGESLEALLNQPLTSADRLETGEQSRAEIQIGSTTIRADANTRLEFVRIDDNQIRVFLNAGRAIVKLNAADTLNEFEMETRSGKFTPAETGIYRFDADPAGSTATTYFGRLRFDSGDRAGNVDAGQSARFWNSGQTSYRLSQAVNDEFTQWSAARDQRPQSGTYSRYISPEMTGAQDLDAYGDWSHSAEYGTVWYPRTVAAGWAPYRTGHWAWISPWGWTWIDDAPWGFAPFHYGRWVLLHGRWGWVPGTRIARPVYAPALVAWVGRGGVSVSVSIGKAPNVGWFPLAPREIYVPPYRSSERYVKRVNVTHVQRITNITNIVNNPQTFVQHSNFANRHVTQAVTTVPSEVMTHRRPVARAAQQPGETRDLRHQMLPANTQAPTRTQNFRTEPDVRRERPQSEPSMSTSRAAPRIDRSTQESRTIRSEHGQAVSAPVAPAQDSRSFSRSEPARQPREFDSPREMRRSERPAFEGARPAPQIRNDRQEQHPREIRQQRESRVEAPVTREVRQEVRRESARPVEQRVQRLPQHQEERQRPERREERKQRHHENERP